MSADSLEATIAQFEVLLDKFERCLVRGNKLNRELTQVTSETLRLGREIKALLSTAREEHASEPGIFGALAEMLAKLQTIQDRNPSLPIQ